MNRRDFLRSAGAALPAAKYLLAEDSTTWRTFEITTRVEILKSSGPTRVWLPAALTRETPFQKTLSNTFDSQTARIVEAKADGLGIVTAEFPGRAKPVLTLTSRIATRNYAVDLSTPGKAPKADRAELEYFRRPTKMLPTDGIVKETATEITAGAKTDLDKARAIYEWIVANTFRDPKTRGCGVGNIRFMLESRDLGGKCADLNALYVGLARAAGLPAQRLRHPRRQVGSGIQEPRHIDGKHHESAALPRRSLHRQSWMGPGRSRRCSQSRPRRAAWKSPA